MDDMRIQILIHRKADDTRSVSIIMHGSPSATWPCHRLPTITDSRVHHTSVLGSPVPSVPVHELSRIFCAISIQSTADDESASTPDTRFPLQFGQRPGPCTKGVASRGDAPRGQDTGEAP